MKTIGVLLVAVACILLGYAFSFETAVQTDFRRVANLDRMHTQDMMFWGAGFMFIGGILLIGFSGKK